MGASASTSTFDVDLKTFLVADNIHPKVVFLVEWEDAVTTGRDFLSRNKQISSLGTIKDVTKYYVKVEPESDQSTMVLM